MSTTLAIRPKFNIVSKHSQKEVIEKIKVALDHPNTAIMGTLIDTHIILKIPLTQQHYWSPQLDLDIEETTNGSLINARFGPRSSVWLMFTFFYSILSFISLMILIMGLAQLNLGMSAQILWGLCITSILFLSLLLTAKIGQQLGQEEMVQLKKFLLQAIHEY